jgi:hypothetical protein
MCKEDDNSFLWAAVGAATTAAIGGIVKVATSGLPIQVVCVACGAIIIVYAIFIGGVLFYFYMQSKRVKCVSWYYIDFLCIFMYRFFSIAVETVALRLADKARVGI